MERRLKRPKEKEIDDLYEEMVNEEKIFSTFKDFYMFCLMLGWERKKKYKLKGALDIGDKIFNNDTQSLAIISAIAIKDKKDNVKILIESVDGESKEDIADEYSYGGAKFLLDKVKQERKNNTLKEIIESLIHREEEKNKKIESHRPITYIL